MNECKPVATGDSALTALHVANEVGIAEGGLKGALMLVVGESDARLHWASAGGRSQHIYFWLAAPFVWIKAKEIYTSYMPGSCLRNPRVQSPLVGLE